MTSPPEPTRILHLRPVSVNHLPDYLGGAPACSLDAGGSDSEVGSRALAADALEKASCEVQQPSSPISTAQVSCASTPPREAAWRAVTALDLPVRPLRDVINVDLAPVFSGKDAEVKVVLAGGGEALTDHPGQQQDLGVRAARPRRTPGRSATPPLAGQATQWPLTFRCRRVAQPCRQQPLSASETVPTRPAWSSETTGRTPRSHGCAAPVGTSSSPRRTQCRCGRRETPCGSPQPARWRRLRPGLRNTRRPCASCRWRRTTRRGVSRDPAAWSGTPRPSLPREDHSKLLGGPLDFEGREGRNVHPPGQGDHRRFNAGTALRQGLRAVRAPAQLGRTQPRLACGRPEHPAPVAVAAVGARVDVYHRVYRASEDPAAELAQIRALGEGRHGRLPLLGGKLQYDVIAGHRPVLSTEAQGNRRF